MSKKPKNININAKEFLKMFDQNFAYLIKQNNLIEIFVKDPRLLQRINFNYESFKNSICEYINYQLKNKDE